MRFAEKIRKILGARKLPEDVRAQDGMRILANEVFSTCHVCGKEMTGHAYIGLARSPLSPAHQSNFESMMSKVKAHRWDELKDFQHWEPLLPDAEVSVFRCPDGRFNLTVVYAAFELGDVDHLLFEEQLSADALPAALGEWKQI
jgi:hypothetical protein